MFDFNAVEKEIVTDNNDIFNGITLDLLDINPCKLFYNLYGAPIIGRKAEQLDNCYMVTNVWDSEEYSYNNSNIIDIPNNIIKCILNNPKNKFTYNGYAIEYLKLNANNIDIHYQNIIYKLRKSNEDITAISFYENNYFTIIHCERFYRYTYFYIMLNRDKINKHKRLYNNFLKLFNNSIGDNYNEIIENLLINLDYKLYIDYIEKIYKNSITFDFDFNNKLLSDGKIRFYIDVDTNKAYFIYDLYSIHNVCNFNDVRYDEFFKLLLLPNDIMYNIIDNIKSDDYTHITKINEHKLNIHITSNLKDVPDYIKIYFSYNYKTRDKKNKLRAIVVDLSDIVNL